MREFKFRAWDKVDKKWIHPFDTCKIEGKTDFTWDYIIASEGDKQCFISEIINVEISQFTGLLDINGKEIYEGDILTFSRDFVVMPTEEEKKKGVVYGKVSNIVRFINGAFVIDSTLNHYRDLCVIGNIYENPELADGRSV